MLWAGARVKYGGLILALTAISSFLINGKEEKYRTGAMIKKAGMRSLSSSRR